MPNEEGLLQPHELAERGLGPAVFGPSTLETTQEVEIMALSSSRPEPSGPGVYVPEEDVTETLPDGRTIQVAAKGAEMPLAEAERLGLVKAPAPVGPAETKVVEPAETKAAEEAVVEEEEPKPVAKSAAKK